MKLKTLKEIYTFISLVFVGILIFDLFRPFLSGGAGLCLASMALPMYLVSLAKD